MMKDYPSFIVEHEGLQHRIFGREGDHISKHHAAGKFYELPLLQAIANLELKGTYLDIGAHVGNHMVFFACHTRAQQVVAFEPFMETWFLLEATYRAVIARTPFAAQIRLSTYALADQPGYAVMQSGPEGNTGMARVEEVRWTPRKLHPLSSRDPEVRSLDALVSTRTPRITLMKIDTEGCELRVLSGARRTIKKHRPVIVVEGNRTAVEAALLEICPSYKHAGTYCATPTHMFTPTSGL